MRKIPQWKSNYDVDVSSCLLFHECIGMGKTHFTKSGGGVNPKVVRVTKTKLTYPSKVSLVFKLPDSLHFVFHWTFREINIECLNDGVDYFPLFGTEGGDRASFKGDDAVVLMRTTEVSNCKVSVCSNKL